MPVGAMPTGLEYRRPNSVRAEVPLRHVDAVARHQPVALEALEVAIETFLAVSAALDEIVGDLRQAPLGQQAQIVVVDHRAGLYGTHGRTLPSWTAFVLGCSVQRFPAAETEASGQLDQVENGALHDSRRRHGIAARGSAARRERHEIRSVTRERARVFPTRPDSRRHRQRDRRLRVFDLGPVADHPLSDARRRPARDLRTGVSSSTALALDRVLLLVPPAARLLLDDSRHRPHRSGTGAREFSEIVGAFIAAGVLMLATRPLWRRSPSMELRRRCRSSWAWSPACSSPFGLDWIRAFETDLAVALSIVSAFHCSRRACSSWPWPSASRDRGDATGRAPIDTGRLAAPVS